MLLLRCLTCSLVDIIHLAFRGRLHFIASRQRRQQRQSTVSLTASSRGGRRSETPDNPAVHAGRVIRRTASQLLAVAAFVVLLVQHGGDIGQGVVWERAFAAARHTRRRSHTAAATAAAAAAAAAAGFEPVHPRQTEPVALGRARFRRVAETPPITPADRDYHLAANVFRVAGIWATQV